MKFIDFFAGIGGFHSGLEKAGMECIGWCEFDKFAQKSYRAMYDTTNLWFGDDVTKVKGSELPKADLWTFGFPCQDVSVAGKRKGLKEGTRSGLFYEMMRLLDECKENKPEWIMCENVKNLLSIDEGRGFLEVVCEMAERGYTVEWKVYNSKDYGVPQNRERVYIVGHYGDSSRQPLLPIRRANTAALREIVGGRQGERVYDGNKISRTLIGQGGGLGAKTGLYTFRALLARYNKGQPNRPAECSGVIEFDEPIRIRRLTPRECFRLQGFTDEQFDRAAAVNSETQLYKQAGNAVTVNVVEEIGKHIAEVHNGTKE
jgi:DNA (cytosine-5)-methyltransferase 1|nr:MAG TPA: Cytosine specific methyltransferase [Caudoviricetes sp.]